MNRIDELIKKLCPNGVEYKKANSNNICQYIVKDISNDLTSYSSTITLQKFYPLYYK